MAQYQTDDKAQFVLQFANPKMLFHEGYLSIGCAPCTSAVTDGDDPRMGRWAGLNKTECGLHPVVPPPIDIENKE